MTWAIHLGSWEMNGFAMKLHYMAYLYLALITPLHKSEKCTFMRQTGHLLGPEGNNNTWMECVPHASAASKCSSKQRETRDGLLFHLSNESTLYLISICNHGTWVCGIVIYFFKKIIANGNKVNHTSAAAHTPKLSDKYEHKWLLLAFVFIIYTWQSAWVVCAIGTREAPKSEQTPRCVSTKKKG